MAFLHGNIQGRTPVPHPGHDRYVAVLDVLGMKSWLQVETPQGIAEQLDQALVACDQACSGSVHGKTYGPLLGTTHFSDTLLVWSPDDSWPSFATMCTSVKMIVAVALDRGVPLRGSISVGNSVCSSRTLRFVGPAIADAFLWSDKQRPYRSVGVDVTPCAMRSVHARLAREPIGECWDCWTHGTPEAVLSGNAECSETLIWFQGGLFLNHWAHGIFTGTDPRTMFEQRGLELDRSARAKRDEMLTFFETARTAMSAVRLNAPYDHVEDARRLGAQGAEYLKLDAVRQERST
ncbi:MAG TPA: hypothetical protein VGI10_00170 [Polyangiaceae bacterium]|jgi:hypothetical protein